MKRREQKIGIVVAAIALVAIVATLVYWQSYMKTPGELDTFAQCISDKGAKFYGAYWCPHCQAQKSLFGKSKDKLPYVECADSAKAQSDACAAAGVQGYPTWIFADNSSATGEQTLEFLSQKTGCVLPSTGSESTINTQ